MILLISKLRIDSNEFFFQFQSHPAYPSALAFSDTLNFLGVKNDAYELEKEFWEELPSEFITLYQNNFALIRRFNDKVNVLIDKEEIISFEELKENSQNFILLFEKSSTENAARTHRQPRQILLFLLIVILLLGNIISWNPWAFVFQVLSLTGVYIFLEIFREKSGSESPVLQSVCGSISKQSSSIDACNKIFKSKDFQFLGLTFSDFGLSYFLGLSILTLLIEKNSYLLVLITGLSLPSIIYSAYYQISKKSFCRVCGVVIIILISQFFIALFNFQTRIVLTEAIIAAFVFLLAFYIIHFLSETIIEKENYRKENIKNLKFKKNYAIFKNQLQSKDRILFENSKAGFFFGNQNAKIHISLVSNPYCGFCKEAHAIADQLIKRFREEISLQIRFNFGEDEPEKYQKLIYIFSEIYNYDDNSILDALAYWYETNDLEGLMNKFHISENSNYNLDVYKNIGEENFEKQLNFTPVILINGYPFPEKYERSDIMYFVDDLLEDEEIINEV